MLPFPCTHNPYYTFLLARLAQHVRPHRATLRFALWDHLNEAATVAAAAAPSKSKAGAGTRGG